MAILNSFRLFCLVAFSIGLYFAYNDPVPARQKKKRAVIPYNPPADQCQNAGDLALTFDEGVSNTNTPAVLDVLKSAGIKATFHLSTQWIEQQLTSAIVRRMYNEGHVIGLRYRPSQPDGNLTTAQVKQELIDQSMSIFRVIGTFPRFVRFPYGTTSPDIEVLANSMGFTITNWNIETYDYRACNASANYTTTEMVGYYVDPFIKFKNAGNLKGAFISLHHDLCPIDQGIGEVIKTAKQYGYNLVTLSQCLQLQAGYKNAPDTPDATTRPTTSTSSNPSSSSTDGSTTYDSSYNAPSQPTNNPYGQSSSTGESVGQQGRNAGGKLNANVWILAAIVVASVFSVLF